MIDIGALKPGAIKFSSRQARSQLKHVYCLVRGSLVLVFIVNKQRQVQVVSHWDGEFYENNKLEEKVRSIIHREFPRRVAESVTIHQVPMPGVEIPAPINSEESPGAFGVDVDELI